MNILYKCHLTYMLEVRVFISVHFDDKAFIVAMNANKEFVSIQACKWKVLWKEKNGLLKF